MVSSGRGKGQWKSDWLFFAGLTMHSGALGQGLFYPPRHLSIWNMSSNDLVMVEP